MLTKLFIKNYAIIDQLEIDFANSLNVITGETGAGKSILMGALSLILGDRAGSAAISKNADKCIVEATFTDISSPLVEDFFSSNEFDRGGEIILRREISSSGKSRAFINDTPVNNLQLKVLGQWLVDLHQQFNTLELGSGDFQRNVLDAIADNKPSLDELKSAYAIYKTNRLALEKAEKQQAESTKELDYNQYLFNELDELNFRENEIEDLEVELRMMEHAEELKQSLTNIYYQLNEAEEPIIQNLRSLAQKLQGLENNLPAASPLTARLNTAVIELKDVAEEIDSLNQNINVDAEKIEEAGNRLSAGYKLLKKHGVTGTNSLLQIKEELNGKLSQILNLSATIENLQKVCKHQYDICAGIADKISAKRKAKVGEVEKRVNEMLQQVGMPNARLKVFVGDAVLNETGADQVNFLFNANVPAKSKDTVQYEMVSKVASGGELSRLMLCIKSLVATRLELPTLIFDEIDSGISGEAARQVGLIMKELAQNHQLIVITHQPQIAAKANAHYFVYKEQKNGRITTGINLLNNEERIKSIAIMMSGEKPSAAAFENAREMIEIA